MRDGFLGFRTSFMLDFVVVALVVVVPILLYSLAAAKFQKRFPLHRNLQLLLAAVLLVAVLAFEVDLHYIQGGWRNVVAKRDPPFTSEEMAFVQRMLGIHLVFAISTPILWALTLTLALTKFPNPPVPNAHSRWHKPLGWASALVLTATSITGLMFYYTAFVRGAN
ncbi:MAG: DUF420 domain-containing protein [Planctomycetaceae bacterium]|nr:DUF420 domain-containing protein [Planctomycetaceae bacterium]